MSDTEMTAVFARAPAPLPPQGVASVTKPTLVGIQLLRAVAAVSVAIAHVQYDFVHHLGLATTLPEGLAVLNAGVDLFFVISGFVMVYASEGMFGRAGAARDFLARRIARIVPLYWMATTIMLAYTMVRGFGPSDASPALSVVSYFFIPFRRPSGEMGPLYGIGWTLNYEMFFYGMFALALFARRAVAITGLVVLLGVLALMQTLIGRLPLPFGYWFNPLILEFVFGMLLATLYRSGFRMPPAIAGMLLLAAVAGFAAQFTSWQLDLPRWIRWGVPSLFAVAALSLSTLPLWLAGIARLGDASYALYLIHPMIIAAARLATQHGVLSPARMPLLYLIGTVGACIGLSVILYERVEKPVTAYCRRMLL